MATTAVPTGAMATTYADELMTDRPTEKSGILAEGPAYPAMVPGRKYGFEGRLNPDVSFEEYKYWAKVERQLEHDDNERYIQENGPTTIMSVLKGRFSKGVHHEREKKERQLKEKNGSATPPETRSGAADGHPFSQVVTSERDVIDRDWRNASRALRTASWGTMFFVLTTDILGWSSAPFVFSSVGYGLGVSIYIIFGVAATFSGWAIWRTFISLDSSIYPMLSFGDPFFRIFGPYTRHFINVTQSLQQFFTVCALILSLGQIISQMSNESICFVACMIIVMASGMIVGSIRSLQRLGWLCNLSVWMNIVSFIIICVAAAKYEPNYQVIFQSGLIKTLEPIVTFAGPPPPQYQQQSQVEFVAQFNGIDSMVYAYAGAILFVAFMAEMRHPMDFWKGLLLGEMFICIVYIFFGVFVYSFFGQYSASNIGQAINPNSLRVVSNIFGLLTGLIAVFLYFNIGMKTVYLEVGHELLGLPAITTKKGRILWWSLGPVYWAVAFVVAAAVPNLNGIVGFVGGLFSVNFTYSFPAFMYMGLLIQENAALPGEGFDPSTGVTTRHDGGVKRWMRGAMKTWYLTGPLLIYGMASLAASGMGTWASIEGLIAVFGPGGTAATSFGCAAPV